MREKTQRKIKIYTAIGLTVIVCVAVILFFIFRTGSKDIASEMQDDQTDAYGDYTIIPSATSSISTYQNEYGYTIQYPSTWSGFVCMNGEQTNFETTPSYASDCDVPHSSILSIVGPGSTTNDVIYLPRGYTRSLGSIQLGNNTTALRFLVTSPPDDEEPGHIEDELLIKHNGLYYNMDFSEGTDTPYFLKFAKTFTFTK